MLAEHAQPRTTSSFERRVAHNARAQAGVRGGAILERTATRAKLGEVHAVAIGTASPRA